MNELIKEGLILGLYGMLLTIFILFLLGFVISLFKFIKSKEVEEFEEPVGLEETSTKEYVDKKKLVALSVALARYFASKNTPKGETKALSKEKNTSSIIKLARWRNG